MKGGKSGTNARAARICSTMADADTAANKASNGGGGKKYSKKQIHGMLMKERLKKARAAAAATAAADPHHSSSPPLTDVVATDTNSSAPTEIAVPPAPPAPASPSTPSRDDVRASDDDIDGSDKRQRQPTGDSPVRVIRRIQQATTSILPQGNGFAIAHTFMSAIGHVATIGMPSKGTRTRRW